jgi:PAP2 superfamily
MQQATRRRSFLKTGAIASFATSSAGSIVGCAPDYAPPKSAALLWNEVFLEAVRKGSLGPPMVARGAALLHTAMYDAWAPFDGKAVATIAGIVDRTTQPFRNTIAAEIAISYAAYGALNELYPAQKPLFDQAMKERALDPNNTSIVDQTPTGIGNLAAKNVIAFYRTDGSNSQADLSPSNPVPYADYTGYAPKNTAAVQLDPEAWQPLTFSNGKTPSFMAPHWGKVRPFAMPNSATLRPAIVLPKFASKEYQDQVAQVLELTSNLTTEQIAVADYWADGPTSETPPGTWCMIAGFVSQRDRHSLEQDIKMFFALGNALKDAGICCWETKVNFNSARPVTAIRAMYAGRQIKGYLGKGKGFGMMAGETWMPPQPSTFVSPPFAEFTSGHSTFSAAGAEVLKSFTGNDFYGDSYTLAAGKASFDDSYPETPIRLSWETFTAAATEAGLSRLLGGIHFSNANEYGKSMGRQVGALAFNKSLAYFAGIRA